MYDNKALQDLNAQTRKELEEATQQNIVMSMELNQLNQEGAVADSVFQAKLEELKAGRIEVESLHGLIPKKEAAEELRAVDADRKKLEEDHKKQQLTLSTTIQEKVKLINEHRARVRELQGRVNVQERILKRRGQPAQKEATEPVVIN